MKNMIIIVLSTLSVLLSAAVSAQSEEAPVAPCLSLETCLARVQTINQTAPDGSNSARGNCPQQGLAGAGANANDYQVVAVEASAVPEEVRRAQGEAPVKWWKIILFGAGVAPVEFFISTGLHEGAHVLAAAASGATITSYKPYPHTDGDNFYFGSMSYRGSLTPGQRIAVSAAPMILDTAVLGTYGALVMSDNTTRNPYVKMGLWVFAAGHWVDMANHFISRNDHTDSAKIRDILRDNYHMTDTQAQLIVRGSQGVVLAVGGYFLYRGMRDLIETNRAPAHDKSFWEKHDLSLAPDVSPKEGYMGLSFSGRF